jgi:hypothetical protein
MDKLLDEINDLNNTVLGSLFFTKLFLEFIEDANIPLPDSIHIQPAGEIKLSWERYNVGILVYRHEEYSVQFWDEIINWSGLTDVDAHDKTLSKLDKLLE